MGTGLRCWTNKKHHNISRLGAIDAICSTMGATDKVYTVPFIIYLCNILILIKCLIWFGINILEFLSRKSFRRLFILINWKDQIPDQNVILFFSHKIRGCWNDKYRVQHYSPTSASTYPQTYTNLRKRCDLVRRLRYYVHIYQNRFKTKILKHCYQIFILFKLNSPDKVV